MTNLIRGTVVLAVCVAISLVAAGEEVRLVPIFRQPGINSGIGATNLVAYDLDGDSRPEMVGCSAGSPFSFSARGATYVRTWHGPSFGCAGVAVGDRDGDGGAEIITVSADTVRIFDPRSLAGPAESILLPDSVSANDVAVGNVDADATPEIVVATGTATYVYDGATLELQWSAAGYGGTSVLIGDVDGDSRREIVVSGSTAYVLDGAAEVQKWGYVGGFSTAWSLGNVDADPKDEIVFRSGGTVTTLHGDTFATSSWSAPSPATITIADGNGDGVNEVIVSDGSYPYTISGRQPAGGAVLWTINSGYYGGVTVQVADLDGDGGPEVFWGTHDFLYVGAATNSVPEWHSPRGVGPPRFAAGDLNGDGRLELVIGFAQGPSNEPGVIEILDAATRVSLGTLPLADSWSTIVSDVAVGQLDGDPALEIAAMVGYSSQVLMTWDGVTRQLEYTSNSGFYNASLAIANLDDDALDEVIIGSSEPTVLVLNGASNIIQKALSTGSQTNAFAVADLNGDQKVELLVAASSGLTVYDTKTWAVLGSRPEEYVYTVAATPADGGTVAVSSYYGFFLFKGAALTDGYECDKPTYGQLAFARIGDEEQLLVSYPDGVLRLFPLDADSCPASGGMDLGPAVKGLAVLDVTGDGRNDLVIESDSACTIALLGFSSETRGDVDGDEVITADDVDAAVDYLFGVEPGSSPSADTNADGRIGVEDILILIDHEFAGGAAPQP